MAWRFEVTIAEFEDGVDWSWGPIVARPFRVKHFCAAPPFALRVACGGKIVTYTGDTEWVDALVPAAGLSRIHIPEPTRPY